MIDQECLDAKVKEWKEDHPSSKIFYRPKFANPNNEEASGNVNDDYDSEDDINDDEK